MYKIIVVDDEPVVRKGIINNINWSKHGFELVGGCGNGKEAIEVIEKTDPDVILTDICMPFVDGIELTRYLADNHPHIKVILLTGYDEFEYARQAVKLKAYDFILKPITAKMLYKLLDKIKLDLDQENASIDTLNILKMQLRESFPLLKERFLKRLVTGFYSFNKILEKFEYFNIQLHGNCFIILAVDVDNYDEMKGSHPNTEDELLIFAVNNIAEEIVQKYQCGLAFQNDRENTIIIMNGDNPEKLCEQAKKIAGEIRCSVEKYLKFTVTVGISAVSTSIDNINSLYKGAVSALEYRIVTGENQIIHIGDMESGPKEYNGYKKEYIKKLISYIKTGTSENINEIIADIIRHLKESFVSVRKCHVFVQQVLISILDALEELGINEVEIFGEDSFPTTEIYRLKTLEQIDEWLKEIVMKISAHIVGKRVNHLKLQGIKAEEYIKQHYNDENISLNLVCKHLLISTTHFSMLIKNHTGETFIEYLTNIRIEKAKEYLKNTNLKNYEVAEKVGYKDPQYFSLIFKKTTGMTPSEYRERL